MYTIRQGENESRIRLCNIKERVEPTEAEEQADALPEMLATLHYKRKDDNDWQDGGLKPLAAEDLPHVVTIFS